MKLVRLWDLRKWWSVQREKKASLWGGGGGGAPEPSQPEESHKQLESEWSVGPQFWQEKELQNGKKNKIATIELCQGRELDYKLYASLGLEGKRRKNFPEEDAQTFLSLDCRMPTFVSWGFNTLIPLRWWGVCVETEKWWQLCLLICIWPVLNSTMYSSLKT